MDDPHSKSCWLPLAPADDQQAAAAIFARYSQRLIRLAEVHLSRKLAGRVDGEEVVQSAFRTFFERNRRGEFKIDGSVQLWQLLVRITLLKARAKARHHTAGMRNVRAEATGDHDAWLAEAINREPSPADSAAMADQIEALLRGLPDVYGQILGLRLEGHTAAEIAGELKLSRQTIYRALHVLQERLA
jgi:RNA polymerase sigma-70 factor (ECF subfamily)